MVVPVQHAHSNLFAAVLLTKIKNFIEQGIKYCQMKVQSANILGVLGLFCSHRWLHSHTPINTDQKE